MKLKKLAAIAIAAICLLSACGKNESPQDVLATVKTNMDACQSTDFDLHIVSNTSVKYEETKIPQKIEYNLNISETPTLSYITGEILTTIGDKNNKYPIEAYQTSANENYSLYYKEDDNWYRQDAESLNRYGMEMLKMFYNSGMSFDKQTTTLNEKECYQMSADVFGEAAADFANIFGVETSEESKIGVTLYVYKDLNYPAYIKIDLKNVASQQVASDEMTVSINDLYAELTFNSFNESNIELPEDIKKNAQKKQEGTSGIIQEAETSSVETEEPVESIEETSESEESSITEPNIPIDEPVEEIISKLSEEWNSFQFEYDGSIYRMPMAFKTFESSGYIMAENERTMIMEQGQTYTTSLTKGNYSIIVKLENTTTSPKTLYECDIVSIDLDTYALDSDELAKFMFSNNVNFAALYDNIVELWGEPTELHDGTALKIATYQDGDNYIEIYFDPTTNAIIEYKICAH